MSSYFDYFCVNIYTNCAARNDIIHGTCNSMCPQSEQNLREKEGLVHILEVLGSERKLVKCYSRSAADSNMAVPNLLRPYNVLRDTVDYLLLDVTRRVDVPISSVYDFVNDRLRAVRQDMTIQRLPPEQCVNLLEPMIRFYVYFGYKLCEHPLSDYDPVLNKKYLLECIKWFLSCYESVQLWENNAKINEISSFLSNLEINNRYMKKLTCDRELMESLYILCNLGDVHPLYRYFNLPKDIKSNSTVQLSYKIAIAHLKGNYARVCSMLDALCPLTYFAVSVYLPTIQRNALRVMSHAYNSRQLAVPTAVLRQWLWFPSDADVITVCEHYGLQAEGATVRFSKADFKTEVATHEPKKLLLHEETLKMDLENIFTYKIQK
ncbi:germinal-center associated nuclear protein [Galleria mellonella]|uniref:Germinal-center associated nuclear protein n=1 Tax=Galleria mellonella TaxID=7137 RepID=A0ABM3N606_GALME|nr:germinal-center associated nuclear protein [Galleria mellonella]